jgi:hypothetical protein
MNPPAGSSSVRACLLDGVEDGAGNDPAGTCEGDGNVEVHQLAAGVPDAEVERARSVEADDAGEVACGVQAERVTVHRQLRAGAGAADGAADDRGSVEDGDRAEIEQLRNRTGSSAGHEREREHERAEHGYELGFSYWVERHRFEYLLGLLRSRSVGARPARKIAASARKAARGSLPRCDVAFAWISACHRAASAVFAGGGSASPAGTRIVVGYTAAGYSGAPALERELGVELIGRIGALRADVLQLDGSPDAALALLRSDPRVRYAELDGVVRASRVPNDEYLPTQWSVTKTHAEQAWDVSTGSSQVVVGILDTGADPSQPDLRGKLVAGYDYVNNDQDPSDDNGHGTAVAGVVAASSDNGIGVAGYCWACRLMPVKVLGADGTGFASGLAQGIVWATDHGARVINASLGSPVNDLTLAAAAQYAWLHGRPCRRGSRQREQPIARLPGRSPQRSECLGVRPKRPALWVLELRRPGRRAR